MGRRWRPDGRDPPIVWRVRMPVRGSAVRLPFAFPARLGVAEAGLGSSLVHGCFRAESTADVGKENRAGRWPQRAVAPPSGHAGGRGRRAGNRLRRRMGLGSSRNGTIANWSIAGLRSRPCRSLSASRGPRSLGGPSSARSPGGSGGGRLGLITLEDVDEILVGADEEGLVARCEHSVAARGVLEQARPGGPSEGEHPDAGGQVGH